MLYRLVEVGQLARRALLAPLAAHGLEPGDDALLFFLADNINVTGADLAAALDIADGPVLRARLSRLCDGNLVARRSTRPDLPSILELTETGRRLRDTLAAHWDGVEDALVAGMKKKARKKLRRRLGDFADLLRN